MTVTAIAAAPKVGRAGVYYNVLRRGTIKRWVTRS